MKARSYRWLLGCVALLTLTLDQWSKYKVFPWLFGDGQGGVYEVIPGVFRLLVQFTGQPIPTNSWFHGLIALNGETMPRVNHGALFGMGNGYEIYANAFFALISVTAAIAIVLWSRRPSTAGDWPLCLALGLILGGTLGNLYDRTVFGGVRDFLYFYWFEWPVFNAADCCLVAGAGLLLIQAVTAPRVAVPQISPTRETAVV